MENWLDQFTVDNLVAQAFAPPQPIGPVQVNVAPTPVMGMDYDLSRFLGGQPIQTPAGIPPSGMYMNAMPQGGAPSGDKSNAALANWSPPQKYNGPARPMPQVTPQTITDLIKKRESSGNYTALNKEQAGNTASGAYQYTDRTWNGYGGYGKAMLAPKHIQDRRFQEDIAKRYAKYQGDPFKIIAEHYLPAAASDPSSWDKPYKLKSGKMVKPVASYVAYVVKGTPLESAFNEYIARQQ